MYLLYRELQKTGSGPLKKPQNTVLRILQIFQNFISIKHLHCKLKMPIGLPVKAKFNIPRCYYAMLYDMLAE